MAAKALFFHLLLGAFACATNAVQCTAPPPLQYGRTIVNQLTIGSVVTYECNRGYRLVGSKTATCTADQKWSSQTPQCTAVQCTAPPQLQYGRTIVNQLSIGSVVTYECNRGYRLVGYQTATCKADQTWSSQTPQCTALQCPAITPIQNGRAIGRQLVVGSTVRYECNYGYRLVGSETVECQSDATWSGQTPTCTALQCPHPIPPQNGIVKGNELTIGSTVRYECNQGYRLLGADSARCQTDSTWSGQIPVCTAIIATTTTQTPCADKRPECPYEAAQGQCQTNRSCFDNCPRSCGRCGATHTPVHGCSDTRPQCPLQAALGQCRTNRDCYDNCPRSCGRCPTTTQQGYYKA